MQKAAKCTTHNAQRTMIAKNNPIEEKSFAFSVRIVNLHRHLTKKEKEFVLSKQILRSGTSIGANVSEAEYAQTKPDFYAKMSIALKEANETHYWLRLLYAGKYIKEAEFNSMSKDVNELIRLLISICKTAQSK